VEPLWTTISLDIKYQGNIEIFAHEAVERSDLVTSRSSYLRNILHFSTLLVVRGIRVARWNTADTTGQRRLPFQASEPLTIDQSLLQIWSQRCRDTVQMGFRKRRRLNKPLKSTRKRNGMKILGLMLQKERFESCPFATFTLLVFIIRAPVHNYYEILLPGDLARPFSTRETGSIVNEGDPWTSSCRRT